MRLWPSPHLPGGPHSLSIALWLRFRYDSLKREDRHGMIQTQLKFSIVWRIHHATIQFTPGSSLISFQCTISDFGCGVLASWEAELTLPAAFGRSPGRRLGFTEHQPIGIQGSRSKTSQHWGREKAVEGIFLS